jgi:hypothetical protein
MNGIDESYWHGVFGTTFTDTEVYVIEKLYQALKARLLEEVVSRDDITSDCYRCLVLTETEQEN